MKNHQSMTKDEFKNAIITWRKSDQSKEAFIPLMMSVRKAFASGLGLGGEDIDAALEEAFAETA